MAKKSIKLSSAEHLGFKKWCDDRYQKAAAEQLGVSRFTIQRVYFSGQGSPETIEKIRAIVIGETIQS